MLQWIVIISLTVLFLHATTWEGMIFDKVSVWAFNLPAFIKNPLFDCPICMAPWYGSIILAIADLTNSLPSLNWFKCILILFASAGLNVLLINIIELCRDYVINVGNE